MSFVSREDVLSLTEGLMGHVFKKTLNVDLPPRFTRLSYGEALERYGTDKPDLRFGMELQDFSPYIEKGDFRAFRDAAGAGGAVKALTVKGGASYSRKQIEELEATAKIYRAKGLAWMKVSGTGDVPVLEGGIAKFFTGASREICSGVRAEPGDLVLVIADAGRNVANTALGAVRLKLGRDLGLTESGASFFEFVWIIDFPMFERNEEENRWEAAHHLFTWPQEKYHATLESDPGSVKGDLYDLVLNGCELASGSIRIHDPELQKRVFKIAGFDAAEAERRFGFLTEAFGFGAPPHGGIAPGLDRLVMLMSGESSIREVIAFPKNSFAVNPMDGSPSEVDEKQLGELSIEITKDQDGERVP
jgi:aspartyl-tRNA synthetase